MEVHRDWYARVLGLQTQLEFVEDGVLMGVALRDPGDTVHLALRHDPVRAAAIAGINPIALCAPTRGDLEALRQRLDGQNTAPTSYVYSTGRLTGRNLQPNRRVDAAVTALAEAQQHRLGEHHIEPGRAGTVAAAGPAVAAAPRPGGPHPTSVTSCVMMFGVIRLYGLLFLVDLALLVIALIDCLSTEEFAVRNLPKVAWVFIILLFSPLGPIVWFVAGRPQTHRVGPAGAWRPGQGFPEYERPRTLAPDDDPEFLRSRRADEELFSRWEADLRRREEELRRRETRTDRPDSS